MGPCWSFASEDRPMERLRREREDARPCFPTASGFHEGLDPRRDRFIGDEFSGIDSFPFAIVQLSLLAVHLRIIDLVESPSGERAVRPPVLGRGVGEVHRRG